MISSILKKVGLLSKNRFSKFKRKKKSDIRVVIVPKSEHCITHADISRAALKVLDRLHSKGFKAYLVGGGVRDILLGRHPKDFDIATDALPEEIRRLFSNCRLIGRRFRLAHIYFGREIIEVATFRGSHKPGTEHVQHSEHGMIVRDNLYGSIEEDALRRDFTVNALYYNYATGAVEDFTSGMDDLKKHTLQMIGKVSTRLTEDPVRMLRALRFAAKLSLKLHPSLIKPIKEHRSLLQNVPSARLFEEVLKLFLSGASVKAYHLMKHYHVFEELFPITNQFLTHSAYPVEAFLEEIVMNIQDLVEEVILKKGEVLEPVQR